MALGQTWEYEILSGDVSKLVEDLEHYGKLRWEAVNMVPTSGGFVVLMKRPYPLDYVEGKAI
jgi:hypothetical protein